MPFVRLCGATLFAVLAFGALAPASKSSALAKPARTSSGVASERLSAAKPLRAPQGLKAFLLRVDERESLHNRTFPRTPAFAWRAVPGAKRYEFELSTSKTFSEGAVVWSSATAKVDVPTPAISPGVALPWITGNPYSLYARVRAIAANGKDGVWSSPFGFNMRWRDKPRPLDPQFPGLMRWTPIEGATMYEVWLFGARNIFSTTTNVADQRELYTFHTDPAGNLRTNLAWSHGVQWRIRAVRKLYGDIPNGLPATTYGPWSDTFTNLNPPHTFGELAPLGTVSGSVFSPPQAPQAHELTPGFVFSGNFRSWGNPWQLDTQTELFRVYVSTDSECVNRVYAGALLGGPAYAPRHGHAIALPGTLDALAAARNEWPKYGADESKMLDGTPVSSVDSGSLGGGATAPKIDLWDTFWPEGGYYWTVVPVQITLRRDSTSDLEYRDIQLPEDVCRAGGAVRFGKIGKPVVLSDSKAPYISGLSPTGKLVGAKRGSQAFFGHPLVAWEPVYGAHEYEVQWSRTLNPWRPEDTPITTPATSAVLPVKAGRWYYRVRGLNPSLPKKPEMTWSKPVSLRVAKPRFRVVR